jgi:hypothetical protein
LAEREELAADLWELAFRICLDGDLAGVAQLVVRVDLNVATANDKGMLVEQRPRC